MLPKTSKNSYGILVRMRDMLRTQKRESLPLNSPGVFSENGMHYVTLGDKADTVKAPKDLAENIALALRVQEKIDDSLFDERHRTLVTLFQRLNCRKVAGLVAGKISLKSAVALPGKHITSERDRVREFSGVPQLKTDITNIIESGRLPTMGTKNHLGIDTYLHDHSDDMPCVVHVFRVPQKHFGRLVSKLIGTQQSPSAEECISQFHRVHSFIIINKAESGRYVCFHKQGPEIHHRFEVRDLDSIADVAIHPEDGDIFLSFIGPISTEIEQKNVIATE